MELHDLNDTTELCHYGVLGMKWGVRRTPEQLGHKTKVKKTPKINYDKLSTHKSVYENVASGVGTISNRRKSVKKAALINKKRSEAAQMSDEDLNKILKRMNLEKQYVELSTNNIVSGRDVVSDILDGVGDGLAITASVLGIVLTLKKLKGG